MWRLGLDGASGTLDSPLATMAGAQRVVRSLRDGDGHIAVWFHDGMYPLTETVVFGPEDSGSENEIIRYGAWDGASPTFHSLVEVEGWESHEGSLIKARLPEGVLPPRFLWDANAAWLPRSASPMFMTDEFGDRRRPLGVQLGCRRSSICRMNTRYPGDFMAPDWSSRAYDPRQSTISWVQSSARASVDEVEQRVTPNPASLEMRLTKG